MNCKDCCQDCQRIGCDIELGCSGYVEPSNGTKERMNERLEMMYRLYSDSEVKHFFSPSEPITNADRIRSMTDAELAEWVQNTTGCPTWVDKNYKCPDMYQQKKKGCLECWLKWLQQEV